MKTILRIIATVAERAFALLMVFVTYIAIYEVSCLVFDERICGYPPFFKMAMVAIPVCLVTGSINAVCSKIRNWLAT